MWLLLKQRWLTVLGWAAIIPTGIKGFWSFVGHAGDVDFFLSHIRDWGWARDIIAWLIDPPSWSFIPMLVVGFGMIAIDNRRMLGRSGSFNSSIWPQLVVFLGITFSIATVSSLLLIYRDSRVTEKYMIAFECNFSALPQKPPADGFVRTLIAGSSETVNLGLSERAAMPDGKEWSWAGVTTAYRCQTTNAGQTAVLNLILNIKTRFTKSDGTSTERDNLVRLPLLQPNAPFIFYMLNLERDSVEVDLPTKGMLLDSSGARTDVNLISGMYLSFSLPPLNEGGSQKPSPRTEKKRNSSP